jgi:hypothetical protein
MEKQILPNPKVKISRQDQVSCKYLHVVIIIPSDDLHLPPKKLKNAPFPELVAFFSGFPQSAN